MLDSNEIYPSTINGFMKLMSQKIDHNYVSTAIISNFRIKILHLFRFFQSIHKIFFIINHSASSIDNLIEYYWVVGF